MRMILRRARDIHFRELGDSEFIQEHALGYEARIKKFDCTFSSILWPENGRETLAIKFSEDLQCIRIYNVVSTLYRSHKQHSISDVYYYVKFLEAFFEFKKRFILTFQCNGPTRLVFSLEHMMLRDIPAHGACFS